VIIVLLPLAYSVRVRHGLVFLPCEVTYLHHLEAKLKKLPAKYGGNHLVKGISREEFELKQKIEALRHAIKFNDMPAQLVFKKES
jgi:hypothetical protein